MFQLRSAYVLMPFRVLRALVRGRAVCRILCAPRRCHREVTTAGPRIRIFHSPIDVIWSTTLHMRPRATEAMTTLASQLVSDGISFRGLS